MSAGRKRQRLIATWLSIVGCCGFGHAQQAGMGCEPYLRFQVEVAADAHGRGKPMRAADVEGTIGPDALAVVSLVPFDLASRANNTLSLLLIVWDGGLQKKAVERFVASVRKEERLHLRLAIVTRHGEQSGWTDDPVEQRRLIEEAATVASASTADQPGYVAKSSDEQVVERRWEETLRAGVEDLIAQPGKQVVLELLPRLPLRPPMGPEHWRILSDRDYAGEVQVHTVAALGVVPVYRVHGETPALSMIVPGGDASHGGGASGLVMGQEQLTGVRSLQMPSQLPPGSRLFGDLGGRDVFEVQDALPWMLADFERVYSVVARTPTRCTPPQIVPLRIGVPSLHPSSIGRVVAPQWVLFRLLQRHGMGD